MTNEKKQSHPSAESGAKSGDPGAVSEIKPKAAEALTQDDLDAVAGGIKTQGDFH